MFIKNGEGPHHLARYPLLIVEEMKGHTKNGQIPGTHSSPWHAQLLSILLQSQEAFQQAHPPGQEEQQAPENREHSNCYVIERTEQFEIEE